MLTKHRLFIEINHITKYPKKWDKNDDQSLCHIAGFRIILNREQFPTNIFLIDLLLQDALAGG
jgi:hypothetical protein